MISMAEVSGLEYIYLKIWVMNSIASTKAELTEQWVAIILL